MKYPFIDITLIFSVIYSAYSLEGQDDVEKRCNVLKNMTVKSENSCLTGNYKLYNNSNDDDNSNDLKECCFIKSNKTDNIGYCEIGLLKENGTSILRNDNTSYTMICNPFNITQIELEKIRDYNTPLEPCGENKEINNRC